MSTPEDDTVEAELKRERENSDRLAAALELLVGSLCPANGDSHLHIVIGNPRARNQLTVGHVIDGALALHDVTEKQRSEV